MDFPFLCLLILMSGNFVFICTVDANCSQGIFEPSCHKVNIALNKPTSQSSTWESFNSRLAVDGNTNGDFDAGKSCSHTDDETPSSWSVSLDPHTEYINNVTLYLRNTFAGRYKDLRVTVDGVLCDRGNITNANDTSRDAAPTPNPVLIRCHQPLRGHNVTVHVNNSYLALCEVQIWVCEDGWFGDDCSESCRCNSTSEVCDKLTGYCRSGCSSGWEGCGCQIACSNKTYGPSCSRKCGHCLNSSSCDPVTGLCSKGCDPGWETGRCVRSCSNNTYGPYCSLKCGHCLDSAPCDPVTGLCIKGCDPGWETRKCDRPCSDNTYGPGCVNDCGHCLNSSKCDPGSGSCSSGCDPGWRTQKCDQVAVVNAETVGPCVPYLVWAIVATVLVLILLLALILLHFRRHHRRKNTSNTQDHVDDVDMTDTTPCNQYEDLQTRGQDNPYRELDLQNNKSENEKSNPYVNQ